MSEQIDWSKAPEGATVLLKHVRDNSYAWAVSHADESDAWIVDGTCFGFRLMAYCWRVVSKRPTTPSWSGEGLPPVGTVLEAIDKEINGGTWSKMVVLAVGKHGQDDCLMVAEVIEGQSRPGAMVASLYTGWERSFRPIRTHEQIAAELADQAIKEMVSIICRDGAFDIDDPEVTESAVALYDAGYRKP